MAKQSAWGNSQKEEIVTGKNSNLPSLFKIKAPVLPEIRIPSPFGGISLPEYELTFPRLPGFNEKNRRAMLHAIGSDVSNLIGWIPVVGDVLADVIEDMHGAEIQKILTPEENREYSKQDKVAPSTIAMARTLTKSSLKRKKI